MESYLRCCALLEQLLRRSMPSKKARPRSRPCRTKAPKPKRVSLHELKKTVSQGKALRVGRTNNPRRRDREYTSLGGLYKRSPTIIAKTSNQRRAENNLLRQRKCKLNVQQRSNAPEKPGYVYAKLKKNARLTANRRRPQSRRGNSSRRFL